MALENSNNFFNSVRGALGLMGPTNKARKPLDDDELDQPLVKEFDSKMKDEDISSLTKQWTSEFEAGAKDLKQQGKDNVNYWIGKQYNEMQVAGTKKPLVDNLIFEAVETFLPIATRANPQAIVTADGTPEGDKTAKTVADALYDNAETSGFRMTLKGITRDWLLYLVGAGNMVWNTKKNNYDMNKVLPSRLILDLNATIGFDGQYYGDFIGEKKKKSASKLVKMFPKKESIIRAMCQGAMGTKLTYVKWSTPTDLFFTIGDGQVLGKYKNPHWNYSGTTLVKDPLTGEMSEEEVEGKNHFHAPLIPYLLLVVFNTGKKPHDDTSLIQQNISIQDLINRRYQQIDRNVDSQNNGIVLSGKAFTKEQAAEAATQLSRGNPLWVPEGDVNTAYKRDQAPALAADVFSQLKDARNELRNIFGTSGSSAQSLNEQDTVRGKIMVNQMDSSRIGGGVTECLEKFSQGYYNWGTQMMYVYYTDEHTFSKNGAKGSEKLSLTNTDLDLKLKVTVKDGSLIPKDPLTKRNEAMDLWAANAIAPIPFYEALDVPNPYESAKELVMWQMIQKGSLPPQLMFPDLEQAQPAAIPNSSPAVNPTEAQAEVNPPTPDTVGQESKQLLQSVPLNK